MHPMLVHDHVVTDFLCNLECAYCPCEVTLMRRRGDTLSFAGRPGETPYAESIDAFVERNGRIIREAQRRVNAPILKVSGGELFLVPEFFRLLPELTKAFAIVQLLTNGTRLTQALCNELSQYSNLHLQISLDGHTIAMNRMRFTNESILDRIKSGIKCAASAGIPLEINTVVTRFNIGDLGGFLLWLCEIADVPATVYFFPVRGNSALLPSFEQVSQFRQTLNLLADRVRRVLPPRGYVDAVLEFLGAGVRLRGCRVPSAVLSTTGHGDLDACTCGPVSKLGSVLTDAADANYAKIGIDDCYSAVMDSATSPACCKDCFTHYDIINLFCEGVVSADELERLPFFAPSAVMERLRLLKAAAPDISGKQVPRPVEIAIARTRDHRH